MTQNSYNWYPGHMAQARRKLEPLIKLVDAVVELCDARAPMATRNPDLNSLTRSKARVLVLNKADLADDRLTSEWLAHFRRQGITAIKCNSNGGKARDALAAIEQAVRPATERDRARGIKRTARIMVIGVPNVGKSTFINRLYGSGITKASDRPGVTRANRWVKLSPFMELLDTPGMLPPRIESPKSGMLNACLGSISDQAMDTGTIALELLTLLMELSPEKTMARFKIGSAEYNNPEELLEAACKGRGWLLSGGRYDLDRANAVILDEFRAGKIGRITLERPGEGE